MSAAVAAGYQVTALDAFADVDTQRMAHASYSVKYDSGHFDLADFQQTLDKIDLSDHVGLVYGSGFEALPDLLEAVVGRMPLIGNTPIVVRNVKRPRQFFMLLDILEILHPEISFQPLKFDRKNKASDWLYKQGGGSGGTHVRKALPLSSIAPEVGHYFQRVVPGVPISLLFVADSRRAQVIGFNQQWLSPTPVMPYRYGGAVGHADLPVGIKQQLLYAAQQLTNAVGLRGLNSLDAMMDGDKLWVLELNPRLSATFDLYHASNCNLFELHIQASAGDSTDWPRLREQLPQRAKAHHIIYASHDLVVPVNVGWPEWAADLPIPGSHIAAGNPVCTILAEADSAEYARKLVLSRAESFEMDIEKYKGSI